MSRRLYATVGASGIAAVAAVLITTQLAFASISAPAWAVVSSFDVKANNGITMLSLATGGDIPRKPDEFVNNNAVAGFAWADLDTGKVFVTTIHPVLGRDSNQNPDSWHAHTATLTTGQNGHNFCVASIDSTPTAGISISGDSMSVSVQASNLPFAPGDIDGAVGFVINPDGACGSGLAVD